MERPEADLTKTLEELGIPSEIITKVLTVTTDEPTAIELALQYTEQYHSEKQATEKLLETQKEDQDYSNELKMVKLQGAYRKNRSRHENGQDSGPGRPRR